MHGITVYVKRQAVQVGNRVGGPINDVGAVIHGHLGLLAGCGITRGCGRRGLVFLLRQGIDDFARTGHAHVLAGDALDGLGVGAQGLDLLFEFKVFLLQALHLLLKRFNLLLLPAHGQEAVLTEDLVHDERNAH